MRVFSRVGLTLATSFLVFGITLIAQAQGDAGNKGNTGAGGAKGSSRVVYVDRPGPARDRIVRILPKTGALTVVAESGASLRLQSLNRRGEVIRTYEGEGFTVGSDERSIIFKNLPPGRYQVAAELQGYRPAASTVAVVAGKADKVELNLVEITYNVTVRTNAGTGTMRFAKGSEVPRSILFQNSMAVLPSLTPGNYNLEISADDASYVTRKATLTVSGDNDVEIKLEHRQSREFLGANASDWSIPSGWSFSSKRVMVRGSGMALPSDTNNRYYTNFQLSTDVRMMNGVAASFAVRALDSQNYYLVEITGPNADEPYVLRGFIVQSGVARRFGRTIPTSQFSETLKPQKWFHVVLTMMGSDITVWVQDSETGDLRKLGILPDPSLTYRIGAVGIAARDGEQNEVTQFSICVTGCQNP